MPLMDVGDWVFKFEEKNAANKAIGKPPVICVIDADSTLNAHNLAKGYLETAKEEMINEVSYNAEYRNIRPPSNQFDNFYPHYDIKKHGYRPEYNGFYTKIAQSEDCRGDSDLVRGVALTFGVDFGHAINSIVVLQRLQNPRPEIRELKNVFAIGSQGKIQDDAINDFHAYYRYHQASNKNIYIYYDNTGNVETGNTYETRAQQMATQLRRLGWRVTLLTQGRRNPQYDLKFALFEKILAEKDPRFPVLRTNILNCKELVISRSNAKIKNKRQGGIEKDKTSEKRLLAKGERQFATDLSDASDAAIFGMLGDFLDFGDTVLPQMRIGGRGV